jgi:ribosomal-protein-alanine N-acetyltransferase
VGVQIEAMRKRDLAQVLEIEQAVFPVPWSRESFRHELGNPCACNRVARHGSEIAGYVCARVVAGELKVNNIAVRDAWRRQGVGARLLASVLELAQAEQCDEATLEVRSSNIAALTLYRRFGFRQVGRRKAYYQDTGEDAILMTKVLTDG